jgi:hypothetical protein
MKDARQRHSNSERIFSLKKRKEDENINMKEKWTSRKSERKAGREDGWRVEHPHRPLYLVTVILDQRQGKRRQRQATFGPRLGVWRMRGRL